MSTFKIKGPIPTVDSKIETLADYFEVQAICDKNQEVSVRDIVEQLLKLSDEFNINGIEDQEDKISSKIEPVIEAISRRINNSRGNYPFSIEMNGNVVAFKGLTTFPSYLYTYLLFATRLNMNQHKVFDDIDGTKLFEELSALVAQNYFGERSSSLVFGTAATGGFESKVNDMCRQLNEGGCFVNHNLGEITENDDALDIIVWKHFEDKLANKLVGFGQCKTGTSYELQRRDLRPVDFCKKWIKIPFNQDPIRLFFIADVMERDKFWKRSLDSGILFDRIRIMDYLPIVNNALEKKISLWSLEAIKFAAA